MSYDDCSELIRGHYTGDNYQEVWDILTDLGCDSVLLEVAFQDVLDGDYEQN